MSRLAWICVIALLCWWNASVQAEETMSRTTLLEKRKANAEKLALYKKRWEEKRGKARENTALKTPTKPKTTSNTPKPLRYSTTEIYNAYYGGFIPSNQTSLRDGGSDINVKPHLRRTNETLHTFQTYRPMCYSRDLFNRVMGLQWKRALAEVLALKDPDFQFDQPELQKSKTYRFPVNECRNGFTDECLLASTKLRVPYSFTNVNFGGEFIPLRNERNQSISEYNRVFYYRIYKNGNDNIRSLLQETYANITNQMTTYKHNAYNHQFSEFKAYNMYADRMKYRNVSNDFAFTFIREPVDRFISGYNEIECRAVKPAHSRIMLRHPLGSNLRFKEFIRQILTSVGSKSFFSARGELEFNHVAPQLGTVYSAWRLYGADKIHLYRLENFAREWKHMSDTLKVPQMFHALEHRNRTQMIAHASQKDPHGIVLNVKAFLNTVKSDSERFPIRNKTISDEFQQMYNESIATEERISRGYLRALCHVLMGDYICLEYQLPHACEDLIDGLSEDYEKSVIH